MLTSFILSQVGEKQNELVFSSKPIDKYELSNYLYSISGGLLDKTSFYRCFRLKHKIVMAHYWRTNYSEIKTGRSGLFVIIGFIIEDVLLPNYDLIIGYCVQFLRELQEVFPFTFSSPVSDLLFSQFQLDIDDKLERLKTYFANAAIPEPNLYFKKIWRKNYPVLSRFPQAIYCINESDDLSNWIVFFYEALRYIKQGYWDISSLVNTSPMSFCILNNGDRFPIDSVRITLKRYQQYQYLLIF